MREAEGEMGDDKSEIDCFPPFSPPKHTKKKEGRKSGWKCGSLHPLSLLPTSILLSMAAVMPLIA